MLGSIRSTNVSRLPVFERSYVSGISLARKAFDPFEQRNKRTGKCICMEYNALYKSWTCETDLDCGSDLAEDSSCLSPKAKRFHLDCAEWINLLLSGLRSMNLRPISVGPAESARCCRAEGFSKEADVDGRHLGILLRHPSYDRAPAGALDKYNYRRSATKMQWMKLAPLAGLSESALRRINTRRIV
ncbi:hypothetical protein BDR22DRAFT_557187 [Usnea florida]